jgi:hypothetical protein
MIFSVNASAASELSEYTIRNVQKAYQLQEEDHVTEAVQLLLKTESSKQYDNAFINRMLGSLYWQVGNPNSAVKHLILAVDSEALPEKEHRESIRMLADLLMVAENYAQAEQRYLQLLNALNQSKTTPATFSEYEAVWLRIAQVQYKQEKWSSVEKSVDQQQHYQYKAKMRAKAEPLKMKLGALMAQDKWKDAITTTRTLRELQPNEELWWRQLTALYMQTKQHSQALITLQQADRAGFKLTQQQLTLMAQLYGRADTPYKAAQAYERLDNLGSSSTLLAQQASYWQHAKEWDKALSSWKKAAALDSKFNRQYALLQMQQKNYQSALEAINRLNKPDTSTLLTKVRVLNELGKPEEALKIATAVHQQSPSESTLSWIKFLSKVQ